MKNRFKFLLFPALAVLLSGCELIEYHPYEVNIKYRDLNAGSIRKIAQLCREKTTIRFVWMGDTQCWYDETEDFVSDVNRRGDVDFVLHGGDISDFGLVREFNWIHEDMRRLDVPYVALVGNHDILGNGHHVYRAMYGPLNFSFIAGRVKFVCLNTNALEFDYSYPVPDFEFIRAEIVDTLDRSYDQTIVAMHANPFGDQFNNNVAYPFQSYITRMKNLKFCLHAHTHGLRVNDYFDDGVLYYGALP